MIDPALGRQLADLGGFALFLLLLVAMGIGLWRGWWVPGPWFSERTAERDALRVELKAARRDVSRLTLQLARERRRRGSDAPAEGPDA